MEGRLLLSKGRSSRPGSRGLFTDGVDFVILEKENQVGSSWRRHYERLHHIRSTAFPRWPKHAQSGDTIAIGH